MPPEEKKCEECGDPLTLLATHEYQIYQGEDGVWHKDDGNVEYTCNNCGIAFYKEDIADVLKQVDEL